MDEKEQKQEEKPEEKGCCGGSGRGRCCCAKTLAVIGLLAIGGIGGYLVGRCGRLCEVKQTVAAPAPANPGK